MQSLQATYSRAYNQAQHPLDPQQYEELVKTLLMTGTASDTGHKFLSDPNELITGEFEHAGKLTECVLS